MTLTKGKRYRLRLINLALDNYIRVSLDNHPMQVMAADFIPIAPFYTLWLLLAVGQRYDVVINANQTAGNYWFRAEAAQDCKSGNNFVGRAIWTYDTVQVSDPTTVAASFTADCTEPIPQPFWKQPVPSGSFSTLAGSLNVAFTNAQVVPGGDTIVVWAVNSSSINVAWDNPTLSYLVNGNTSYPTQLNVVPTLSSGQWNYWLLVSRRSYDTTRRASSS